METIHFYGLCFAKDVTTLKVGDGGKTQENAFPLCSETNSCHFTPLGDEPCFCSQFPPLFQAHCYLLSVCNMLSGTLRITSIHFTKKKKKNQCCQLVIAWQRHTI